MARTKRHSGVLKPIPIPITQTARKTKPTSTRSPAKASPKEVSFAGNVFHVSPVLDTFYWFTAERHRIHQLRISGEPAPWTDDEIMSSYPFTNVFRVYDRTTQFILRNVIERGSQNLREISFRVILFRLFNRIETWERLERELGTPTLKWHEFNMGAYESVLESVGGPLYSGAYISPAPAFGWEKNYSNHLRLVQLMMEDNLPSELKKFKYLKDAHGRICLYPSVGEFIGFQLLLDLNMTPHFDWNEHEWAALGPGSSACLRKIFGPQVMRFQHEALRYLNDTQRFHFDRLNIRGNQVPRLCEARPAGLSMVDIEHSLCECEKYSRARFPHIKGKRTQVGRPYVKNPLRLTSDLPDHWLRPRPISPPPPEPPAAYTDDGEPYYEVSHVVAERRQYIRNGGGDGVARYLVRWVGYSPDEDWWMSENDLKDTASELLKKWNAIKVRIEDKIAALQ